MKSMWLKGVGSGAEIFYRFNGEIGLTLYYPESRLKLDRPEIPVRDRHDDKDWYLCPGEWALSVSLSRLLYV